MQQSIPTTNPSLPFMGSIPGGLIHGRMIRINGRILPGADRVTFNLQSGPSITADNEPLDDDIILHVDIRLPENNIILNHNDVDGWGNEEIFPSPIQEGENFELLILAQSDCYKLAINGNHFCEFPHRMPLQSVQCLYVCRDASIFSITLEGDSN